MNIPELTHIWCEVSPFSDLRSLLPEGVALIEQTAQLLPASQSAFSAQAILASSLIQYNEDLLSKLPNLRFIVRTGIGIDNLDLEVATAYGVVCCHTPDGPTESTAEHTVAMLLALSKRLKQGNANLAAGKWGPRTGSLLGREVIGKCLGLIGLGRIGRRVAQICQHGFQMNVLAYDPYVDNAEAEAIGVQLLSLEEVLERADFLSVHVPSTPETYHLMDRERIALMKDGACLLNLARGPLVDMDAVIKALDSGKLCSAGFDVYEPEPPPLDSPVRNHPNIIATPHIAGVTEEGRTRMEQMALERLLAFFRGQKPDNIVNPKAWEQLVA